MYFKRATRRVGDGRVSESRDGARALEICHVLSVVTRASHTRPRHVRDESRAVGTSDASRSVSRRRALGRALPRGRAARRRASSPRRARRENARHYSRRHVGVGRRAEPRRVQGVRSFPDGDRETRGAHGDRRRVLSRVAVRGVGRGVGGGPPARPVAFPHGGRRGRRDDRIAVARGRPRPCERRRGCRRRRERRGRSVGGILREARADRPGIPGRGAHPTPAPRIAKSASPRACSPMARTDDLVSGVLDETPACDVN